MGCATPENATSSAARLVPLIGSKKNTTEKLYFVRVTQSENKYEREREKSRQQRQVAIQSSTNGKGDPNVFDSNNYTSHFVIARPPPSRDRPATPSHPIIIITTAAAAGMLYELNLAWSPATTPDRLLQVLSLSASLGYATVALNHTLELPLPAKLVSPFTPLLLPPPAGASPAKKLPHVLHRATLLLADPAASNYRLPALAAVYDVLAIRPLTEKAFQNACLTLDVPIISLDLAVHFPFHFRPKSCMAAVARGVRFEICYAQLLAADSRGRANFIANLSSLVRATRGRGFLISSEAQTALALRGPADVVNLLSVWGLASERGLEGFRSIPRSVVVNEGIKRNGFRGVIDVVQVAPRDGDGHAAQSASHAAGPGNPTGASATGAKAQKRKPGGDDGGQPTSKRQAKKMKLAAHSAGRGKP
ncbi:RNase P subunit p30 [Ophiocordyceps sinensis CO18]|uniref:RNase P subunit p30 n=1 Tax=Ophiocordyceps sinensis (strain Co18 / CGMCC 3.14243) TaxID=911162 RepID=T5ABR0_OPHSC|nr:RNase P subunit p30 [Ophiocordyceps sinensis CO18]